MQRDDGYQATSSVRFSLPTCFAILRSCVRYMHCLLYPSTRAFLQCWPPYVYNGRSEKIRRRNEREKRGISRSLPLAYALLLFPEVNQSTHLRQPTHGKLLLGESHGRRASPFPHGQRVGVGKRLFVAGGKLLGGFRMVALNAGQSLQMSRKPPVGTVNAPVGSPSTLTTMSSLGPPLS